MARQISDDQLEEVSGGTAVVIQLDEDVDSATDGTTERDDCCFDRCRTPGGGKQGMEKEQFPNQGWPRSSGLD
jgi:hypothetical protein